MPPKDPFAALLAASNESEFVESVQVGASGLVGNVVGPSVTFDRVRCLGVLQYVRK